MITSEGVKGEEASHEDGSMLGVTPNHEKVDVDKRHLKMAKWGWHLSFGLTCSSAPVLWVPRTRVVILSLSCHHDTAYLSAICQGQRRLELVYTHIIC